jgi:hypothetical protein
MIMRMIMMNDYRNTYIVGMIRHSRTDLLLVSRIVHSLLNKGNHMKVEALIMPPRTSLSISPYYLILNSKEHVSYTILYKIKTYKDHIKYINTYLFFLKIKYQSSSSSSNSTFLSGSGS